MTTATPTYSESLSAISGAENISIALKGLVSVVDTNATETLTTTLSVSHGTISAGAKSGSSVTFTGTAAQIDADIAAATYKGATNYYGGDVLTASTIASMSRVLDTASATITLLDTTTVSERGSAISGAENAQISLKSLSVSDTPNTSDPLATTITVANGVITVGQQTGSTVTLTGDADQIDAQLATATYLGHLNFYGTDSLTMKTVDSVNGQSATIGERITLADVTTVSETGAAILGAENTALSLAGISVSDTPNTSDALSTVLSVADGTISAGGQTGASVTLTGTAAQIDAELKTATYKGKLNYTGADSLSIKTTDTVDGQTASLAERITLTASVGAAASVTVLAQYAATGSTTSAAPSGTTTTAPQTTSSTTLAKPHLLS